MRDNNEKAIANQKKIESNRIDHKNFELIKPKIIRYKTQTLYQNV